MSLYFGTMHYDYAARQENWHSKLANRWQQEKEDDGLPCEAAKFDSNSPPFRPEFVANKDDWKFIATISVRWKQNSELHRRQGDDNSEFHLAGISQRAQWERMQKNEL